MLASSSHSPYGHSSHESPTKYLKCSPHSDVGLGVGLIDGLEGLSLGDMDGCSVGPVGLNDGFSDGLADGLKLGCCDGELLGLVLGMSVGDAVGAFVGDVLGLALGIFVGEILGLVLGMSVGDAVGAFVGDVLGLALGMVVGDVLGLALGTIVGEAVGVAVVSMQNSNGTSLLASAPRSSHDGAAPFTVFVEPSHEQVKCPSQAKSGSSRGGTMQRRAVPIP